MRKFAARWENGKRSLSRQLFSPKHRRLGFQSILSGFGQFFGMYSNAEEVGAVNLKKIRNKKKMCSWRPHSVLIFFQIRNIYFFTFEHIQTLALIKKYRLESLLMWFGRKSCGFFTISSGWRIWGGKSCRLGSVQHASVLDDNWHPHFDFVSILNVIFASTRIKILLHQFDIVFWWV